MFGALLQKIRRNLIDYGFKTTVVKSVKRLLSPIYRAEVYRLYRIDLKEAPSLPNMDESPFEFRLLRSDESDIIAEIEEYAEFLRGEIPEIIDHSGFCYIATHDNQLAGFNLISFGNIYMPLVRLNRVFRSHTAWSEHIAVMPNFRRMGLASLLRYHIFEELRSRRYNTLYGGALKSNFASLKLAQKVGFRLFVDIEYTGILWLEYWRYRRV